MTCELLEERRLLATFTVNSDQDPVGPPGTTTLRQAIAGVNASTDKTNTINFDIGTGLRNIVLHPLSGPLPVIRHQVTIDGTTESDYIAAGKPRIQIDGSLLSPIAWPRANGIEIQTRDCVVTALAIVNFTGSGIFIGGPSNSISRNFLGITPDLDRSQPNLVGLTINNAVGNVIGGTSAKFGNVISGNAGGGIVLNGAGANSNTISASYIGTGSSGLVAIGSTGDGIVINGGSFNVIGGDALGSANIISGNSGNGITLRNDAHNNTVEGNFIGTDGFPDLAPIGGSTKGTMAIPNGGAGVSLDDARNNQIGGFLSGQGNLISGNSGAGVGILNSAGTLVYGNYIGTTTDGQDRGIGNDGGGVVVNGGDPTQIGATIEGASNVIAYNGQAANGGGVQVVAGHGVSVLSNSIFGNFGPGILLVKPGATHPLTNDPLDGDDGPNGYQNWPVIERSVTGASKTLVRGVLGSAQSRTYTVQFFGNDPATDPADVEAKTLLGTQLVSTNALGLGNYRFILDFPTSPDQYITAIATDEDGNTSEIGEPLLIKPSDLPDLNISFNAFGQSPGTGAAPNPATVGATLTYTVTVVNISKVFTATNTTFHLLVQGIVNPQQGSTDQGVIFGPIGNAPEYIVPIGAIAPGGHVTLTIPVIPSQQTASLVTIADTFSDEIDPNPTNDKSTMKVRVDVPIELGLTNPHTEPADVHVGENVTFVVGVKNSGPGTASNVSLTATLPDGLDYVDAIASSQSGPPTHIKDPNTNKTVITLPMGAFANNDLFFARITARALTSGPLTVPIQILGDQFDRELNNNAVDIPVVVKQASDLALSMTADAEPVLLGQNLTYTLTVTNRGPSVATNVTITDPLPAGLDVISTSPTSGVTNNNGTITANLGDLGVGASRVLTIVVTPTVSAQVTNIATVASDQDDLSNGDNTASLVSSLNPVDLGITVAVSPETVEAGQNQTFTFTIVNNGPAPSQLNQALAQVALGSNATINIVSATSTQGTVTATGPTTFDADLGPLAVGATAAITIVASADRSAQVQATGLVMNQQFDPVASNNSTQGTTAVSPADVAVTITPSSTQLGPTDPVTFTAVVRNNGPFTASGVVAQTSLAGYTLSGTPQTTIGTVQVVGTDLLVQIGSLAPGVNATITFTVVPTVLGQRTQVIQVLTGTVDPADANNNAQTSVAVANTPGVLQFSEPVYVVSATGGFALITVTRTSGTLGGVSIPFTTAPISATPDIDFTAVSGLLSFLDGQTSQTFTIPVKSDGVVNGDKTVSLSLGSPSGGATVGPQALATLVIKNTDVDLVGPTLDDVQLVGTGRSLTGMLIRFSEALNPTGATNPFNYTVQAGGKGAPIPILPPQYDPSTNTVAITLARPLPGNGVFHRLTINGTSAGAITDIYGNPLLNGEDYAASFARGASLRYTDGDGDRVALNVSRGLLDIFRDSTGEAQVLRLVGTNRASILSGSVRKPAPRRGNGRTTFQRIENAGFGRVTDRLTTAPFYVQQQINLLSPIGAASTVRAFRTRRGH